MSRNRRILGGIAATTLAAGLSIGSAEVATAGGAPETRDARGTCGQSFNPELWGGKAHWVNSCRNGKITVKGWVQDTSDDGECVYVVGVFNNDITKVSGYACTKGQRVSFNWTHAGTIADVTLRNTN
ncbi:hypothetical protein ABT354_35055 [Streptomyces sp. NPDC000594]|uniref:hypothetical protein n=1 Tax=Streptomyces sp. NPDC000594 TaxID=3154261 RepID=UPI00331D7D23